MIYCYDHDEHVYNTVVVIILIAKGYFLTIYLTSYYFIKLAIILYLLDNEVCPVTPP